jgi:hypothetical protein
VYVFESLALAYFSFDLYVQTLYFGVHSAFFGARKKSVPRLLLPAATCCCLLLPAAACCCLLLPAAACCCLLPACCGISL